MPQEVKFTEILQQIIEVIKITNVKSGSHLRDQMAVLDMLFLFLNEKQNREY